MPVTPLHFYRYVDDEGVAGEIMYGWKNYITDCGRFVICGNSRDWAVTGRYESTDYSAWSRWIDESGIGGFVSTRKQAIQMLTDALKMDELTDADSPHQMFSDPVVI